MTTLDAVLGKQPALRPAAVLLRALLDGMQAVEVALPTGTPDLEGARVRVTAGIPALEGEPLVDGVALVGAARTIAQRLAEADCGDPARHALSALERVLSGVEASALAHGALAGAWEEIAEVTAAGALAAREVDEQTLITLLDYSVRPALRAAAAIVRDSIADARWARGSCPACGAPPLLAELCAASSGGDGERSLRCGRCATAWSFPRVTCPACGTTAHRALGYLHVDGEVEFRRAATCARCMSYVKEIAVLDPLGADALLEEDLATLALDLIAVDRGYRRGAPARAID